MSCSGEKVTGFVDGALVEEERAAMEAHLAECAGCREQAEAEEVLRTRLRELPTPDLPQTTPARVRRGLRRRPRLLRYVVPLAATLLVALWARGMAPVVAWELVRDHEHCYAHSQLPAEIWSQHPEEVAAWFAAEGARLPLLPESAAGMRLAGGRFCPLPGFTRAPHLYYVSDDAYVSLFVVPRWVRFDSPHRASVGGHPVRLLRVAGSVVGLVGQSDEDVAAFERAFSQALVAARLPATPTG